MREVRRSALVPFSPAQMFALVDDIDRYPSFLPWVASTQVLERGENYRLGSMTIVRAGMQERITTRNSVEPPHRLVMSLVDGPFNFLEGIWTFDAIGASNHDAGKGRLSDHHIDARPGTKIGLVMRFEFKSLMSDLLFGKVFEASCDSLVDAFVKQAKLDFGQAAGR